ncbi:MAG: PEP-CTERM sorting domain-containing protein [Verrucomicrobia bacterium]|nr:PEP-CTERM sorting domain-containing protein [Verrucomicrobiota bacterium]
MKASGLLVLAGVVLFSASAAAQSSFLLAGNIGDGSGIVNGSGATFTGNPSPFFFVSRQAIPFTLASTAQLGAVQVTISNLFGGGGVFVSLAPDNGSGAPDDARAVPLGAVDTGTMLGSGYEAPFVPLTSFPQLDAGQTYWIVLRGAPNSVYVWNRSNTGPLGSFIQDETSWSPNTFSYGFAVYAVPEPATLAAGVLAVGALGWRWRRRR